MRQLIAVFSDIQDSTERQVYHYSTRNRTTKSVRKQLPGNSGIVGRPKAEGLLKLYIISVAMVSVSKSMIEWFVLYILGEYIPLRGI